MRTLLELKAGDRVKFHTPNADETKNQVFELLEDTAEVVSHARECGMEARIDIRPLGTGLAIPPIQTVNLNDLCAA